MVTNQVAATEAYPSDLLKGSKGGMVMTNQVAAMEAYRSDLLKGLKGGTVVTNRERIPVCLNSLCGGKGKGWKSRKVVCVGEPLGWQKGK